MRRPSAVVPCGPGVWVASGAPRAAALVKNARPQRRQECDANLAIASQKRITNCFVIASKRRNAQCATFATTGRIDSPSTRSLCLVFVYGAFFRRPSATPPLPLSQKLSRRCPDAPQTLLGAPTQSPVLPSVLGRRTHRAHCGDGRLAQRESTSFTPRGSLVQSQYRPPSRRGRGGRWDARSSPRPPFVVARAQ